MTHSSHAADQRPRLLYHQSTTVCSLFSPALASHVELAESSVCVYGQISINDVGLQLLCVWATRTMYVQTLNFAQVLSDKIFCPCYRCNYPAVGTRSSSLLPINSHLLTSNLSQMTSLFRNNFPSLSTTQMSWSSTFTHFPILYWCCTLHFLVRHPGYLTWHYFCIAFVCGHGS